MDPKALKSQTETWLASENIGFLPSLPLIESLEEMRLRPAEEVARRMVALSYLTGLAHGVRKTRIRKALEKFDLWSDLTSIERVAVAKRFFVPAWARIETRWMNETLAGLAWCLGMMALPPFVRSPNEIPGLAPPWTDPSDAIMKAKLRPKEELQISLDRYYRLHWAVREGVVGRGVPKDWHMMVIERRRAIEWVCAAGTDWEDISLDT